MGGTTRLLTLSLVTHVAEATSVSDPVVCYVLDAFLLLYCIIFTALYFRQKFSQTPPVQGDNTNTGEGGTYEAIGTQSSNPESGVVRRQRAPAAEETHYAALQHRTVDTYSQIQTKKKKKKDAQASRSQVYESLQQQSREEAYNSLEMRPLPPQLPPK